MPPEMISEMRVDWRVIAAYQLVQASVWAPVVTSWVLRTIPRRLKAAVKPRKLLTLVCLCTLAPRSSPRLFGASRGNPGLFRCSGYCDNSCGATGTPLNERTHLNSQNHSPKPQAKKQRDTVKKKKNHAPRR